MTTSAWHPSGVLSPRGAALSLTAAGPLSLPHLKDSVGSGGGKREEQGFPTKGAEPAGVPRLESGELPAGGGGALSGGGALGAVLGQLGGLGVPLRPISPASAGSHCSAGTRLLRQLQPQPQVHGHQTHLR